MAVDLPPPCAPSSTMMVSNFVPACESDNGGDQNDASIAASAASPSAPR